MLLFGLLAVLNLYEKWNWQQNGGRIEELSTYLKNGLSTIPQCIIHTPMNWANSSGNTSFSMEGYSWQKIGDYLLFERRISSSQFVAVEMNTENCGVLRSNMKKYFGMLFIMLVLGLGISANLMAVDYYVNPADTDDVSHGSASGTNAWQTIQYAVDSVNPTTATIVIHVSGDTYTLNSDGIDINRSFTNLTIQGAGAGTTIVQAHASKDTATDRVFNIVSGNTVAIKDMNIGTLQDNGYNLVESSSG